MKKHKHVRSVNTLARTLTPPLRTLAMFHACKEKGMLREDMMPNTPAIEEFKKLDSIKPENKQES